MKTLAQLLAEEIDLGSLSDEDLETRRVDLDVAARSAAAEGGNAEIVDLIEAAAVQVGDIVAEQALRADVAAELQARIAASLGTLDTIAAGDENDAETAPEGAADVTAAEGETETAETDAETAADGSTAAEPGTEGAAPAGATDVTAADTARARARKRAKVPATARPRTPQSAAADEGAARPTLRASGESRNVPVGSEFADMDALNEAMFDKWLSLAKSRDGHPHMMATLDYRHLFGPEATIKGGSPDEITDKILSLVEAHRSLAMGDGSKLEKLRVASGGVPGPPEPMYQQITFGDADRPFRDALPKLLMPRGQVIYNGSPTLADVLTSQSNNLTTTAIGTVTSAQDLAGGANATKNVQEMSAPSSLTATVEAETMRWSQGNFADRFYPERTAAFMRLGMVAFARHNESLRLTDLKAACTQFTDAPAKFGAYRDLKAQFLGQLSQLRDLLRDYTVPVQVVMPAYVPAMLAMDMSRQAPGDETWNETVASMRADIESWDPLVRICWVKDSIRGRLLVTPTALGGTANPRTGGFDADVEWSMFPVGAFLHGDGGQLDLGILRDTVVSATNKFQTFYENWEGLVPLLSPSQGVASPLCFWMTSALCADGVSQAAQNVAVCSAQDS